MAAGGAIIGALRVVLGADTADLEKGLKAAQAQIGSFAAGFAKHAAMAAAAFATVGAGVALAVKGTINEADKLGKMAQSIGVPVAELSRLKHAADLSGVGIEALGVSVGKLSKNMVEMAGGGTGPATEAFKALKISVTNSDGSLKSSSQVMTEIAGKFGAMEDGAGKTALAIALFGKSGAAMIPMLNAGKIGLAGMMAEADQLGIVITEKTAKAAEAFNDNLTRLGKVKDGIIVQVTSRMLPAFEGLSQILIDAAKNSRLMDSAATVLTATLRGLVTAGVIVGATFKALGEIISSVVSAIVLASQGEFSKAWDALKTGASDVTSTVSGTLGVLQKVWSDANAGMATTAGEIGKKLAAPILQSGAKNALQSFLDSTIKRTAAMEAEAQTIGKSAFETARLKVNLEALAVAKANNIPITEALKQKIDGVAVAFATMSEKAQFGKQIFEQTRTPVEQFGIAMERLNTAMQRGAIDSDTYARGVAQAQQQLVQANPHAQNLGNALESAFDRAMESGAKLSDVLKALVQDLIKMEARTAFKALLYGPQGGTSGGMLGGLFGGFGKLFGFAEGGSFPVGGSGGIDSQVVAFRASPNERVTVTKPGQGGGMGGGVVIQQTNHFSGDIKPSDRSWIMSLVDTSRRDLEGRVTSIVAGDLARDRDALGVPIG